jgi:hypothetical protein
LNHVFFLVFWPIPAAPRIGSLEACLFGRERAAPGIHHQKETTMADDSIRAPSPVRIAWIESPTRIDQYSANLCGVAAFVRELAYDDPVQYGLLGACLYEGGWGNLGRRRLKRVEPRVPTRMERVPRRDGKERGLLPLRRGPGGDLRGLR